METKTPTEFAIIETGGKQYRVAVGDVINIEKLDGEMTAGDKVTFDKVLLVENAGKTKIGSPYVDGAKVQAIFEEQGKAKKINIIKFKSKSRYFIKNGHRQPYTQVKISSIQ
ncbi:MAG: 50S ribosomal protein L21 [Candidatus Nomurabacteria bacterium]|nr:50S ribosomal protein L21 [Candidatus Nomurabacteria bacterium]